MPMMLALLAAASAQGAEPQPVRVQRMQAPDVAFAGTCAVAALDLSDGQPVVQVTVNGKGPYRFVIDTGAQGAGRISAELAEQLGLEAVGEVRAAAPGGSTAARKIYRAGKLAVGAITFADADLVTMPVLPGRTKWDGVLGIDLFHQLTLTLDYGKAALKLSREPVAGGVAASFANAIGQIPLRIGGREVTVDLDTGNGAAPLFLSEALAKAIPLSGPATERGKARTSFGEFSIMQAPITVPVTVGGTPLPITLIAWPSARGEGNLGSRGLAGMRLSVDRANGRVAIEPSGEAPTCA
jgi:predicted aspartyl protease